MTQSRPIERLVDSRPSSVPPDVFYRVVASQGRRTALRRLVDADGPVPVRSLARDVLGDTEENPEESLEPVRASLYHVHLPRLSDAGLVCFAEADREASLTEAGEQLAENLSSAGEQT